ncbi:response regulator, partial [bacterium]|nr:response regulator [bacterium]
LGDVLKTLAVRAHAKGLELAYEVERSVPDAVVGDMGRLRQVLVNLVGNAIKFTDDGEVIVRVDAEEIVGEAIDLHFAVRDTGTGIEPERQDAVFLAFSQGDGSTSRKHGGTGLGLAICSQLVGLMGGRIWLASEPGAGSTFHFTVRVGRQQAADGEASGMAAPSGVEGLNVLVVDDNASSRGILKEMLESWCMRPTTAADGAEAMSLVESSVSQGQRFDVVLLDADMPGLDGFAVAERLRRLSGMTDVTLLMLTATQHHAHVARCRELGVATYLVKPIRPSDLLDAIVATRGMATENPPPDEAPAPAGVPHAPRLHVLLAEDNPVNQRLAVRLLEKAGHAVAVVGDGRRAVERVAQGDFDLVLMDVQMPEMDGFEATQAIREGERGTGRHTPIIAMTAHAMKGDRERCLAAGMDAYVAKPVRRHRLEEAIEDVTRTHNLPARNGAREPMPTGDFDVDEALERVAGDRSLLRELAATFLDSCPALLARIDAAITAGDSTELERAAHELKGAAATLAGPGTAEAAFALERMGREGNLADATGARSILARQIDGFTTELVTCTAGEPA